MTDILAIKLIFKEDQNSTNTSSFWGYALLQFSQKNNVFCLNIIMFEITKSTENKLILFPLICNPESTMFIIFANFEV